MIPIRIPIYRGLLGLRLLLITPSMNQSISKIKSLDRLRSFTGGHGAHWGDLPVYGANKLRVATSVNYQNLFKMLIKGRFDYFHRGVNEIWGELDRYSEDLIVADKVMLFYPHPVYFFIGKHRPELAAQLERGMKIALEDGSFKKLFLDHHQGMINEAQLENRTLIVLKNPAVPQYTPQIDTSWWLPKDLSLDK